MLPLSPGGRRYGFKKSLPDHRDFGVTNLATLYTKIAKTNNKQFLGPVKDQGQLGSCTANAGAGNREYLLRKFQSSSDTVSALFLYYLERQLDGTLDQGDCGSTGRSSCIAMQKSGVCLEKIDPYNVSNFQNAPTPAQIADAATRKAGAYHTITNVQDMKSCVASGYPFLLGFTVYESFESQQTAESGKFPMPNKQSEQILGGHEVLVFDYDDSVSCPGAKSSGAFFVRNSWGSSWGQDGNFWMPYEAFSDPDIFMEAHIQHLGHAWV